LGKCGTDNQKISITSLRPKMKKKRKNVGGNFLERRKYQRSFFGKRVRPEHLERRHGTLCEKRDQKDMKEQELGLSLGPLGENQMQSIELEKAWAGGTSGEKKLKTAGEAQSSGDRSTKPHSDQPTLRMCKSKKQATKRKGRLSNGNEARAQESENLTLVIKTLPPWKVNCHSSPPTQEPKK